MRFIVVLLLALLVAVPGVLAQDDADDTETEIPYAGLYEDIPQSRTEDGAFVIGEPDAPVTVIEFADFLCPHCQDYHEVATEFIETYVATGQAKFEYRFFPIIDENYSSLMAGLNECAGEEGLFWPAHSYLYDLAESREIDADLAVRFAEAMGLEQETLFSCLSSAEQFITDFTLGQDLQVTGTPAIRVRVNDGEPGVLVINGRVLSGGGTPLELLAEFVESENPEELVQEIALPEVPDLRDPNMLQEDGLVTLEPCAPPCWRGITPGETNWAAAMEILESDETLADVSEQAIQGSDVRVAVVTLEGDVTCCQIVSGEGDVVRAISLRIAPTYTLGEVIEVHGEPDFIGSDVFSEDQIVINLYFEDVPMLVFAFVAGEEGDISEDSEVIGVAYVTEEDMNTSGTEEWQGYAAYSTYFDAE
ncbi:MAG: hypothetical protein OHK0046_06360 [Anaerolineae bacterium]